MGDNGRMCLCYVTRGIILRKPQEGQTHTHSRLPGGDWQMDLALSSILFSAHQSFLKVSLPIWAAIWLTQAHTLYLLKSHCPSLFHNHNHKYSVTI